MASGIALRLESDVLDDLDHEVLRIQVSESLDEPYVAVLDVTVADPAFDPLELLGADVRLLIQRDTLERRLNGVVRTAWEGDTAGQGAVRARIEVVPAFALLSLTRDTRMFQEKTVPEILTAVLEERLAAYGRELKLDLVATYPRREYCMQYQESDLAFAQRLMESEGISYAFEHDGDVELLVLRDDNKSYARVPSFTDPIELHPHDLVVIDREPIHQLERRHAHTSTAIALRDFDWTTGGFLVDDAQSGEDTRGRVRESYEHGLGRSVTLWDYAAAAKRYQQRDTPRQKKVRLEGLVREQTVGFGVGRVIGFAPGVTFELTGHPHAGLDGEYLVTRVEHVNAPLEGASSEEAEHYHNRFECIPLSVPHRPRRRTPKPRIPGVQTALVTGPSGEEIHTDEHGRIKVQFHWDRENPADDTSSCWVRCEQAWAGAGWGFFWLPRVGMEVVVHFLDGDPDRPLVTGCVYDGANATPYPLPDEKTKSTIKSNSSPGGGGSNELRFEDKAGSEEIYAHAQKDYNEVVENDHSTLVHANQTNEVDGNQTQTIHGNQQERVDGDQTMSVGGDRTVHVEGNFDETIDGTETRTVTGDVTETFDANETRQVAGDVSEDIGASETRSVGGSLTESIGGAHTLRVGGSATLDVTGSLSLTVAGGVTQTTPAAYDITALGGMTVVAAAGARWVAPAGVKIMAPGGVTFIDAGNDWMGGSLIETEGYAESLIGFKIETGGGILEVYGAKLEIYPVFISAENMFDKEVWAGACVGQAVMVKMRSLNLKKDLIHHEG